MPRPDGTRWSGGCIARNPKLKRHRSRTGLLTVGFQIEVSKPNRGYRKELIALAKQSLKRKHNTATDYEEDN